MLPSPRHHCPARQLEAQIFNLLKPPRLPKTPLPRKAAGGPKLEYNLNLLAQHTVAQKGSWRPKTSIYLNLLACPRHHCPEKQLEAQIFNLLEFGVEFRVGFGVEFRVEFRVEFKVEFRSLGLSLGKFRV